MRTIVLSFILLLSSLNNLFAANKFTNGNSTNWNNNSAWNGTRPDINGNPNDKVFVDERIIKNNDLTANRTGGTKTVVTVQNGGNMTVTRDFFVNNSRIIVQSGGRLEVGRNMRLQNNSELIVENGATLIITGQLRPQSGSDITLQGTSTIGNIRLESNSSLITSSTSTLNVNGQLRMEGGTDVIMEGSNSVLSLSMVGSATDFSLDGVGTLDIANNLLIEQDGDLFINGGDFSVGGNTTIRGSGEARVNSGTFATTGTLNVLNNAKITGGGIVSWGTPNVNPANSAAFIGCADGSRYDNLGATVSWPPMPANPLDLTPCGAVLPIELLSFEGELNQGKIYLNWATVTEINNDFFTVERSSNGKHWNDIGLIDGAGNSHEILDYSFIDDDIGNESLYYRLKQTDTDGSFSYSDIIFIQLSEGDEIQIFPNPSFNGVFHIDFEGKKYERYKIHDVHSIILDEGEIEESSLVFNLKNYPSGVYIVDFYSLSGLETKKLIKY